MELSLQKQMIIMVYKKGYRVSSCGKKVLNPKGRSLKLSTDYKKGKPYMSFPHRRPNGGKATRVYVHKLKAYQLFKDEYLNNNLVVCHKNDISNDNSDDNIRLGTQHENILEKIRNMNKIGKDDLPF